LWSVGLSQTGLLDQRQDIVDHRRISSW